MSKVIKVQEKSTTVTQRDLFQVASCFAFCVEKTIQHAVIGHRLVCWLLLMSMGQASLFVVEVHRSPLSTLFERIPCTFNTLEVKNRKNPWESISADFRNVTYLRDMSQTLT